MIFSGKTNMIKYKKRFIYSCIHLSDLKYVKIPAPDARLSIRERGQKSPKYQGYKVFSR